jgi:hypothetical protein
VLGKVIFAQKVRAQSLLAVIPQGLMETVVLDGLQNGTETRVLSGD